METKQGQVFFTTILIGVGLNEGLGGVARGYYHRINIVENNGTLKGGYGFFFSGNALDVILQDNIIRDNRNGTQKAAIFINKNTPQPKEVNNKMSGHKLGNIVIGQ